jgi:hypothetical protein
MGIKLAILSVWTPKNILCSQLDNVYALTISALKDLLRTYGVIDQVSNRDMAEESNSTNLSRRRDAMTREHFILVRALIDAVGEERAVKLGRETLFKVGERLGKEARQKLGVGNDMGDLFKAAKILYRVLGINFRVEEIRDKDAVLIVDHCELAKNYSELTCRVLSATDEGVLKGLNPNVEMKFERHLTGGCDTCIAKITLANRKTEV